MARLIFMRTVPINGVPTETLLTLTTAAGNQGAMVKQLVPADTPFWWFASIPPGKVIAADFTDAPIRSSDAATNNASIAAITALPEEVLVQEPFSE